MLACPVVQSAGLASRRHGPAWGNLIREPHSSAAHTRKSLPTALLVGAAWAIDLAVAERQIRKRPRRGTPAAPVQVLLP